MTIDRDDPPWHALEPAETLARLDVDPSRGLSAAEAAGRRAECGPNEMAHAAAVPAWRKVLGLLSDHMTLVLVVAAVVSAVVAREWRPPWSSSR